MPTPHLGGEATFLSCASDQPSINGIPANGAFCDPAAVLVLEHSPLAVATPSGGSLPDLLGSTDVVKLYAHVKGASLLEEGMLIYADVTEDSKVNIMDVVRLYAHVKGTALLF